MREGREKMPLYRRLLKSTQTGTLFYGYIWANDALYNKFPNDIVVTRNNNIGTCQTTLEARNIIANYLNDEVIALPMVYHPAADVNHPLCSQYLREIFPNIVKIPVNSSLDGHYIVESDDSEKYFCLYIPYIWWGTEEEPHQTIGGYEANIGLITSFDGSTYFYNSNSPVSNGIGFSVVSYPTFFRAELHIMVYPENSVQNGIIIQPSGNVQRWFINISFFNMGTNDQSITIGNSSLVPVGSNTIYYLKYGTPPIYDTTYSAIINQQVTPYTPTPATNNIADCTVVLDPSYQFTGSAIVPTNIYVYDGTTQLTENVDYTVGVTNNTYVGQANVNIAGIGNYTGTQQVHFNITRRNINEATVSLSPSTYTYDGTEKEPTVTATFGSYTLQRSVDYTVVYSNNINPGIATVTLNTASLVELDTGNFTGSTTATFTITGDNTPYDPGGTTVPETGPTDGTWTLENDVLSDDHSPHNDLGAHLFRVYAMDKNQLYNFSKTLWRSDILTSLKTLLSSPLDAIISLASFPFIVNSSSTAETIEFNWISEWLPDGWTYTPTGYPIVDEYQTLTMGTITIPRYSGTFYDYQPYSQAQLYIPFYGSVEVKINEILGKTIELKYHINVLTGDFTAIIKLTGNIAPQILGQYQGNMLRSLPLSYSGFADYVGNSIKTAAIVGTAVVAANAGKVANGIVETIGSQVEGFDVQLPNGNSTDNLKSKAWNRTGISGIASAIASVASSNAPIQRNGNIDAVSGRTSTQEAFLLLSLPHQNIPNNQKILGYPTNLPGPLVNYSGYTEVRDIRLKSGNATYSELAEIEQIVRGGIVI